MSCGIYKITNKINGHSYIGQSVDIERRWRKHINFPKENSNYPLYRAFVKYGIENFNFEILKICDKKDLDIEEIKFIAQYNTFKNGYNQTTGGGGNPNSIVKLSNEDIIAIIDLLRVSNISQKDIAKLYNVGQDTISEINQGKTRVIPNINYPIRKNHNKYKCKDCGITLNSKAERCIKCQNIKKRQVLRPSRKELKNMIRNLPFTKIGEKYNVSDNTIRKWCISEKLPSKKSEIKKYSDKEWEKI